MRRRFIARTVLRAAVVAALLRPCPARAEPLDFVGEEDEEIRVDAESISYERAADVVSASGAVEIRRGDTLLRADQVWLNRRTREAEAIGHATLTTPEGEIRASEMRLNLDDETGALVDAEIHSDTGGYSLWGERIEKGLGQHYHIENGRFTTCRCALGTPPSWSISGKRLDVALDGYAALRGGNFNVHDFRLLPVPRAWFPVNRERHSGFLLPRVGISNRRGFQYLQPFYWAISRSYDATFAADVETSARFGILGEYRYAPSRSVQGRINASYFNEAIRGAGEETETSRLSDPHAPENRWGLDGDHAQRIGPALAYADLMVVGDDLFLREINTYTIDHRHDVALRTLPFTTSRAGFLGTWKRLALQGEAIVYQDLVGRPSRALQRVPELSLEGQKRFGSLFFGWIESSATDFQRGNGITGLRGDIKPTIQFRLPLGRSVYGSLQASMRGTGYQLTESRMDCGYRSDECVKAGGALTSEEFEVTLDDAEIDLPGTTGRGLVEVRGDLRSGLARVFDFPHLGVARLKHTIEPVLRYLYVPSISQGDLPVFDTIDRIHERNLVYYGVASRLLARGPGGRPEESGEVYELLRVDAFQAYDFSRDIPGVGLDGPADHLSDVDFALRVHPSRRTSVRVRSSFDTGDGDLSFASVGIRLDEPFGEPAPTAGELRRILPRTSFGGEYRFVRDNEIDPDTSEQIQQLDSSVLLRVTDRLGLLYATRYDIVQTRFLGNHFGLRFVSACDCWSFDVGVTDKSNPDELELRAQLTLVGLGSAGTGTPFGRY